MIKFVRLSILALLLPVAACAPIRPVPPNPPTGPVEVSLNLTAISGNQANTAVTITPDVFPPTTATQTTPTRFGAKLVNEGGVGASVGVSAPGFVPYSARLSLVTADLLAHQPSLVSNPNSTCTETPIPTVAGSYEICPSVTLAALLPPPPTRDALIHMKVSMYGTACDVPELGGFIPWWDPGAQALSPEGRKALYPCKHAAGDTGIIIGAGEYDGILYDEPDNPYQIPIHPFDLAARVIENAQNGFLSKIILDGDGSNSQLAFDEFPRVYAKLLTGGPNGEDLNRYVQIVPGWDGVFYSCVNPGGADRPCWTPESIIAWASMARGICPYCNLGLEFNTGHIPLGEGGGDFLSNGRMKDFDSVLIEFDYNLHNDNTWQIVSRLLGPAYIKPPDDPNGPAPWYMSVPTIRGPWGVECFEPPTYSWVRVPVPVTSASLATAADNRAYLVGVGCPVVD